MSAESRQFQTSGCFPHDIFGNKYKKYATYCACRAGKKEFCKTKAPYQLSREVNRID